MQQYHKKQKKTYATPRLANFGDMRNITRNIGTKGGDSVPSQHSR